MNEPLIASSAQVRAAARGLCATIEGPRPAGAVGDALRKVFGRDVTGTPPDMEAMARRLDQGGEE